MPQSSDKKFSPNLYLLGFMGTGKSALGKRLAKRLGFRFIDSDAEIESKCGMETKDIFAKYGEEYFRKLEREFIESGHPDHGAWWRAAAGFAAAATCPNL